MEKIGRINQYDRAYGFQEVLSISKIEEVLEKVDVKELIKPADIYAEGESYYDSMRIVIDCRNGEVKILNHRTGNFDKDECFYHELFKTSIITEIEESDLFGFGEDRYTFNFTTKKGIALFREFVEEMEIDEFHNKTDEELRELKELELHCSDYSSATAWIEFFHNREPLEYADYSERVFNVLEHYLEADIQNYQQKDLKEFYNETFYVEEDNK